jgi:hypothetical protein
MHIAKMLCDVRVEDYEYFEHLLMQTQMRIMLNESLDLYDQ